MIIILTNPALPAQSVFPRYPSKIAQHADEYARHGLPDLAERLGQLADLLRREVRS